MEALQHHPRKPSLEDRIEQITKSPGIKDILEWTFAYDEQSKKEGKPFNTTFFTEIGGVSYQDVLSGKVKASELCARVENRLGKAIHTLRTLQLRVSEEEKNPKKAQLYREGIESHIDLLTAGAFAVAIELEKSCGKILSKEQRDDHSKKIFEIHQKVYGKRISEDPEEVERAFTLIREEFHAGKHSLSDIQKNEFEAIYNKMREGARMNLILKKEEEEKAGLQGNDAKDNHGYQYPNLNDYKPIPKKQDKYTKRVLEEFGDINISKEEYMEIFQFYIYAMNLPQKVEENAEYSSIYDAPENLFIPTTPGYQKKSLKDVLLTLIHEIAGHAVNQQISANAGLSIRLAGNTIKEEGLAILIEYLFEGFKLDEYTDAGYSSPYILAGQFLSLGERQKFIDFRILMDNKGKVGDANRSRELRLMRGFPLDSQYTQLKDQSYGNGPQRILQAIREGKAELLDFYQGKVGIDHILNKDLDGIVKKEHILMPMLFAEVIIFMLGGGAKNKRETKGFHTAFLEYVAEKYKGVIKREDIEKTEIVQFLSRMKLGRVLQILSRSNLEIASALDLGEGRKQVEAWGRESGGIPIAGISLTKQKEGKEGNTENDLTPTV